MSSTIESTATTVDAPIAGRSLLRAGVAATVVAAAATTAIAAIAEAAGVSFTDHTGSAIPLTGFTMLTVLFSLIGVGLAALLRRRANRPQRTFLQVTLSLLVLSFVPDLISGFSASSAVVLILAHTAAAAIVIPALAHRLPAAR